MKEKELRAAAKCAGCDKPFGHTQAPIFHRITFQSYAVNLDAVQRQWGLTAMLGGSAGLAAVMGPDEDMATALDEATTITLCADCYLEPVIPARLHEAN